jgi:hypothetical protein
VGRFPVRFALETYRSRYRYFYKHFGLQALAKLRWVSLLHLGLRYLGYRFLRFFTSSECLTNRLAMYRVVVKWNWLLDPIRFIETGEEPQSGYEPLAPAPTMVLASPNVVR